MTFLTALLSGIGFMAIFFGIAYVVIRAVEFQLTLMSEVRACKREIERLEILVKGFPCKQG